MTARPADVCVSGSGSVFLLSLLTGAAREWVDQHVSPDHQTETCPESRTFTRSPIGGGDAA